MSDDIPTDRTNSSDQPDDDENNEDEPTETDEFAFPPPKRRRPLPIIAAIVLIIVLVGGGLLVTHTVGGAFGPAATPTPTLIPGENLFYVTISPPWGTISIDGRRIAHLPLVGATPLVLSPGGHTITWNAPPFQPQSCIVYVPPQQTTGGACSTNDSQTVQSGKYSGLQATVLSFTASTSALPTAQRSALYSAAQEYLSSLQSTDMVQPGEQYIDVNAPHLIATAAQPLKATLHFQLDTNANSNVPCVAFNGPGQSCQGEGGDCHQLCNQNDIFFGGGLASTVTTWDLYGVLRISWDYAALSGQTVASDQPDIADSSKPEFLVPLYISWDGGHWHVSGAPARNNPAYSFYTPLSCLPTIATVNGDDVEPSYFGITTNALRTVTIDGQIQELNWLNYMSGSNAAQGCLAAISPNPNNPNTPITANLPTTYCLYRLGVLIAANVQAHRYWPQMPVLDAYEQGIVQKLMHG